MKKITKEQELPPSPQSQERGMNHRSTPTSADAKEFEDQPGGSRDHPNSLQEYSNNKKEPEETVHHAKENESSNSTPTELFDKPMTKPGLVDSAIEIFPAQRNENEILASEEASTSNNTENEDPNVTSLREMFPDLLIANENLTLSRLQQMSTTDITRQIVSLNKPALLKPAARLIPPEKTWLSPLQEVDKSSEEAEERELASVEQSDDESDSDSEDETTI